MALRAQPIRSSAVKCWWWEKTISASLRRWVVQDSPASRRARRNASISFPMSIPIARIQAGPPLPRQGRRGARPASEVEPDDEPGLPLRVVGVAELVAPAESDLVEDGEGGPPGAGAEMHVRAGIVGPGRLAREEVVPGHVVEFGADGEPGREAVGEAEGVGE